MHGVPEYAHEYFFEAESIESSTCRELHGILMCLQSVVHLCAGKFGVSKWTHAKNLLGIVNCGSSR